MSRKTTHSGGRGALIAFTGWLVTGLIFAQGVAYDSQGKRDPFLNLQATTTRPPAPRIPAPPPLDQRPPGLAGLLIAEVTVVGTARGSGTEIVMLKGIDEITYFARGSTKLFDGYVEKVTEDEVVFVRVQVDTAGSEKTTRVTKRTQTEER